MNSPFLESEGFSIRGSSFFIIVNSDYFSYQWSTTNLTEEEEGGGGGWKKAEGKREPRPMFIFSIRQTLM